MGEFAQDLLEVIHLNWLVYDEIVQSLRSVDDRPLFSPHGGGDGERVAQMRRTINFIDGANRLEEGDILIEKVCVSRISSSSIVLERRPWRKGLQRYGVALAEALEDRLRGLQHVLPERVKLGLRDAAGYVGLGEVGGGKRLLHFRALEISEIDTLKE